MLQWLEVPDLPQALERMHPLWHSTDLMTHPKCGAMLRHGLTLGLHNLNLLYLYVEAM